MAKSKSFFGLRSGSTKSLTFSQFNGKQVTKDRVTDVKNPRTQAQMENRMVNYTVMKAYSAMKKIVDHSFANKTYGLQSMRYFLSKNYALINNEREDSYFSTYKGFAVPNKYLVSEGSLSSIPYDFGEDDGVIKITIDGKTFSALKKFTGLNAGDYFTIVMLDDVKAQNFAFIRFYIPDNNLDSQIIDLNSMKLESFNTDITNVSIDTSSSQNAIISFDWSGGRISSAAVISSAKRGDKWERSTEYMKIEGGIQEARFDDALATYPKGASYVLNGGD